MTKLILLSFLRHGVGNAAACTASTVVHNFSTLCAAR